MAMLSFRVDDGTAADARRWAERLGVDRSELLREALRRHLAQLADATAPACPDWGPSEDWSDWRDPVP